MRFVVYAPTYTTGKRHVIAAFQGGFWSGAHQRRSPATLCGKRWWSSPWEQFMPGWRDARKHEKGPLCQSCARSLEAGNG